MCSAVDLRQNIHHQTDEDPFFPNVPLSLLSSVVPLVLVHPRSPLLCCGTAGAAAPSPPLQCTCTRTNIHHSCPFVASATLSSTTDKTKAKSCMLASCAQLVKQKVLSFSAPGPMRSGHRRNHPPTVPSCYSKSLHFVGMAILACLFTSSPRPSCMAGSSAALRATAPVRSLVHAWPCSVSLRPFPAFPSPSPPCHFLCTPHILSLPSCPIFAFPPDSHMLSWLRCAHFGTFAALTHGV
jgi:hypothetical protein